MRIQKPANIARRMAAQFWGPVQVQKKIGEGIWWFSTAGHGRIVVDTAVRTSLREFQSEVTYRGRYCIPEEQHFAAFEEDCEACKVEWTYPSVMPAIAAMFRFDGELDGWIQERIAMIRESLERWNPVWLAQHPEPGWGEKLSRKE